MRTVVGWCGLVLLVCVGCGDSSHGAEERDCAKACAPQAPCPLSREEACEFTQPSPWVLFFGSGGDFGANEIFGFPEKYAGKVEPLLVSERISDAPDDREFAITGAQVWSPDGATLVFETARSFSTVESRLFATEFGVGVPGLARRLVGLPAEGQLSLDPWDPASKAFSVRSATSTPAGLAQPGALYLVRREGRALEPALVAPASERVIRSRVCAGAEHVAYLTEAGEFVIRSAAGRTVTFGTEEQLERVRISDDARWVVLSSTDGEHSKLTLVPCGEGAATLLETELEPAGSAEFSADSRYLAVRGNADMPPSYVDLADPATRLAFPDDVTHFIAWGRDETHALLSSGGGLLVFWPSTGESRSVHQGSNHSWHFDPMLLLAEIDDAGKTTSFELIDLRHPEKAIASHAFSAPHKGVYGVVDDAVTRFAFLDIDADGARVIVLNVGDGSEVARFEFPGSFDLRLYRFRGHRSGFLVQDEGALYFLPLDGGGEAVSIGFGQWLTFQGDRPTSPATDWILP